MNGFFSNIFRLMLLPRICALRAGRKGG